MLPNRKEGSSSEDNATETRREGPNGEPWDSAKSRAAQRTSHDAQRTSSDSVHRSGHEQTHRNSQDDGSGKYKLLAELGRGGMANVYLAVARGPSGFNKLVVLKCLRSDLANDPELLNMFMDEARLAARLNHPHVVQTYEVGEYMGRPVIVMEYLEGQTLSNLLQRTRSADTLPLPLHLRVIIDALEGLHHAHELTDYAGRPLNLVHRDVSPQNIFITFDGQVKVLDFGIAKAVTSSSQTSTGILKGKVQYMAPEQMLGIALDRRADLYAVGVMVWEAATGQRMWKGTTDIHIMNKVANEGVPSPREVNPDVSPELEHIIMKALARDPDQRYPTALDFAGALELVVDQMGTGASNRNLGKLMRDLFEDTRNQTRSIVEAQLAEAQATSTPEAHLIPPNLVRISMRPPGADMESPASGTGSNALSSNTPIQTMGGRRGVVPILIGGAAVAAAAIAMLLARIGHRNDSSAQRTAPAVVAPSVTAAPTPPPAPVPTAAPAVPSQVSLAISSTPKRATLFLDGHQLTSNPYKAVLPNDGTSHRVRAEALGYTPRIVDVVPDHDTDLVMALEPIAVQRGGQRTAAPPPPPTVTTTSDTTQTNTGNSASANKKCNPPYFIDADGIKRFRPECL